MIVMSVLKLKLKMVTDEHIMIEVTIEAFIHCKINQYTIFWEYVEQFCGIYNQNELKAFL